MTTETSRRWVFDLEVSLSAMILHRELFLWQSKTE
jgi:hypothetical protein